MLVRNHIVLGLAVLLTFCLSAGSASAAVSDPFPWDGAISIYAYEVLSWSADPCAVAYDVYYGTVEADVNDANNPDIAPGVGRQTETTYAPDGGIPRDGGRHYWRVDVVTAEGIEKGPVWSFTAATYAGNFFTNATGNRQYTDPDNWLARDGTSVVPNGTGYSVRLERQDIPGPILDDPSGRITVADIRGPGYENPMPGGGVGTFDINSDFYFYNGVWRLAYAPGTKGILNITGGLVEMRNGTVYLGGGDLTKYGEEGGAGTINMSGGTLLMHGAAGSKSVFGVGKHSDDSAPCFVNLSGGTIWQDYPGSTLLIGPGSRVDISGEGQLIFRNDIRADVSAYLAEDKITANGGDTTDSLVKVLYDGTFTTILIAQKYATVPSPVDHQADVAVDVDLSWGPGLGAVQHDVYFGTSFVDVNNATNPNVEPGKGRQTAATYDPGLLGYGETYYWRIDEINTLDPDSPHRGKVWSFSTLPGILIDDMESYGDLAGDRIYDTYDDGFVNGTGSEVWHAIKPRLSPWFGGNHAMGFDYDNTGSWGLYSEISLTFTASQDWTNNLTTLSLLFYGTSNNAEEQMYIALEDATGKVGVVNYSGSAADLKVEQWQNWNILLSEFSSQGVQLAQVRKIYIGFGDRSNPAAGGTGTVYFDDIGVYPPRCVQDYATGDLTGDCVVDFRDVEQMSNDWLLTDYNSSGLLAWYKFDETDPNDNPADSTVFGHDGINGGADIVAGYSGNALSFDEKVDVVTVDVASYPTMQFMPDQVSFAFWAYGDVNSLPAETCILNTNIYGNRIHEIQVPNAAGEVVWWAGHDGTSGGGEIIRKQAFENEYEGQWVHWAFTKNTNTGDMKIYRNGTVWHSGTGKTLKMNLFGNPLELLIGRGSLGSQDPYFGMIDDVRIYTYELTQAQVQTVMGGGTLPGLDPPMYFHVSSDADLNGDNKVNFEDFAELAANWLQEIIWP